MYTYIYIYAKWVSMKPWRGVYIYIFNFGLAFPFKCRGRPCRPLPFIHTPIFTKYVQACCNMLYFGDIRMRSVKALRIASPAYCGRIMYI